MKIAVSASGRALEAEVDPRFGRCQCFILVDPETMEFEVVENSSATAAGGAGISAAEMIIGKGAKVVLTGNCGPNAYQVLSSAGVQVVTGVSGNVRDAVEGYKSGKFKASSQPNVPGHFGTGGGFGMGMGRGAGMGRRMASWWTPPTPPISGAQDLQQEIEMLKSHSQMLARQLDEIRQRIDEIEKRSR